MRITDFTEAPRIRGITGHEPVLAHKKTIPQISDNEATETDDHCTDDYKEQIGEVGWFHLILLYTPDVPD